MSISMKDKEINNNQKISSVEDLIKKRKDPKTMTVEELEEYISKNKTKFKEGGVTSLISNCNKSLNSTMNSQKVLNRSYTAGNNNFTNNLMTNIQFHPRNPSNDNLSNIITISKNFKENQNEKGENILQEKITTKNFSQNFENFQKNENDPDSSNNLINNKLKTSEKNSTKQIDFPNLSKIKFNNSPNNSINPFLNNLPSSKQNYYSSSHNISENDQTSDGEEKFKFINMKINQGHNFSQDNNSNHQNAVFDDINNPSAYFTNVSISNSTAANNYLKTLQEKIQSLIKENEELKKNFIDLSEILEKERNDYQKKVLNEINKGNEAEKYLKQEIHVLTKENKDLKNELNQFKEKLTLLNSNISILENEKGRHLEQNALEKEKLTIQVDKNLKEIEEMKKKFLKLENENKNFKDSLGKKNEEIQLFEKNFTILKEENMSIKVEFRDKINEYNKEIEKIKNRFEAERGELLENIKALKHIVKQLDAEKKDLSKKYENNIKEFTVKINRLERNPPSGVDTKSQAHSPSLKSSLIHSNKSKDKSNKYHSNLSITKDKPNQKIKPGEIKIFNIKNKHIKVTKSPGDKKFLNLRGKTGHDISQGEKSSRKSSRSNPKTSSNSKITNTREKKTLQSSSNDSLTNPKNSQNTQNSMLSGFGTNSIGFLSPIQTNASLENISSINNYLMNKYQNNINNSTAINISDNDAFNKIYSINSNKEEMERNNYLNMISNSIFELERNIADMNRNYKNMLIKLNTNINSVEEANMKRNINSIANNLQEQSEKLLELKSRQQELLKTSLKNNRIEY